MGPHELGAFGFLTTAFEMSGALMMLVILGTVAVAAAWFLPGAYGWQELADVVALAAAAGATALGSRATLFDPEGLFEPLP
ncbi:MAG TPA: hypothetical protein VI300_03555 [Solirubrobacter sp.]